MKVLVANRGEIAVRLIKSCESLGFHSTAIYSDEDGASLHVRLADAAVALDQAGAPAYLDSDKILAICKDNGIEAVIPGYGFLSENNEFAALLHRSGITFVGPDPESIVQFGLKHRARALAVEAGVPIVPGSELINSIDEAMSQAERIGYPIMVKATAGGGGMGLSVCRTPDALAVAVEGVRSRGTALFKDGGLFLEKYVDNARHIEGQVFGNGQGDVLWLGERECSLQRRHQKVVEESPSPFVLRHPELRDKLKSASLALARSVKYKSAGTIEFLVNDEDGEFYFLEMNTRLQVEHGVTELCYDVDIVNMMLLQAKAEREGRLGLSSEEMGHYKRENPRGHSVEVRVYAENPVEDHKPAPGLFTSASFPTGEGIRVDTWLERGSTVTPFFDPLLAKVMVHAGSRSEALELLDSTLAKTRLHGPPTNIEFLRSLLKNPDVVNGNTLTSTLSKFTYEACALEFKDGGLYTTIQDYPGRPHRQSGVPVSGPLDNVSFRIANMLVGNHPGVEGLEMTYTGAVMIFHQASVISLCGAEFEFSINGEKAEMWTRHSIPKGAEVSVGSQLAAGCRAYLAILGGFPTVDEYLGSKSTTPSLQWGGYQGRTIRTGDMLQLDPVSSKAAQEASPYTLPLSLRPVIDQSLPVYALPGPYDTAEFVTPQGMQDFYSTEWTVAFSSSRGGLRLDGPTPAWSRTSGGEGGSHPSNVLGYGFPMGGFSFTGDAAVIFTADSPVQSGFISLQTVLTSEMWKLGQLKPGDTVRFAPCSWEQARTLERALDENLSLIETEIMKGLSGNAVVEEKRLAPAIIPSPSPETSILYERPEQGRPNRPGYLPRFILRQAGDRGILCDFGSQVFDLAVRVRVQRIVQAIWESSPHGFQKLTRPHTMSVLTTFDPNVIDQKAATATLIALEEQLAHGDSYRVKTKKFHLPMVFDAEENKVATKRYMETQRPYATYLPDNIDFIRRNNGMTYREEVLAAVQDVPFVVLSGSGNMGMPIMVHLDPRIQLSVPKANPSRTSTPAGALGIGGKTFALYPSEQPGGYMLYGLTIPGCPFDTWGLKPDYAPHRPWLFEPFDQIVFHSVSRSEFDKINRLFQMGLYKIDITECEFNLSEYLALVRDSEDQVKSLKAKHHEAAEIELAKENKLLDQWRAELKVAKANAPPEVQKPEIDPSLTVVKASMNAKIWKVKVSEGSLIELGDVLVVLEAMKMEISVRAPSAVAKGYKVVKLLKGEGDLVNPGDALIALQSTA